MCKCWWITSVCEWFTNIYTSIKSTIKALKHWWVNCLWVQAGKMVLYRDLRLFYLTLDFLNFLWHLIWVCTVCQCPSPGFTDNPLYTALWRHSDKNNAAINNSYLDFVQTPSLISLVNDNHVDNNLKKTLRKFWCMYTMAQTINPKIKFIFYTVNVLKFRILKCPTKWHMQTVQSQIRLLLKGLHCLSFHWTF